MAQANQHTGRQIEPEFEARPSEGMRLLRTVPVSARKISKHIGIVGHVAVGRWRRGAAKPSPEARALLEEAYAIPADSWDALPAGPVPALSPNASTAPVPAVVPLPTNPAPPPASDKGSLQEKLRNLSPESEVESEPEVPARNGDPLHDIQCTIAEIQRDARTPGLLVSQLARLRDAETKALGMLAKLQNDRAMLEDRVVREHPQWRKIRDTIFAALETHPEALRDVVGALGELAGE